MLDEGLEGAGDGVVALLGVLILGADYEAPQVLMNSSDGFSGADYLDRWVLGGGSGFSKFRITHNTEGSEQLIN